MRGAEGGGCRSSKIHKLYVGLRDDGTEWSGGEKYAGRYER